MREAVFIKIYQAWCVICYPRLKSFTHNNLIVWSANSVWPPKLDKIRDSRAVRKVISDYLSPWRLSPRIYPGRKYQKSLRGVLKWGPFKFSRKVFIWERRWFV